MVNPSCAPSLVAAGRFVSAESLRGLRLSPRHPHSKNSVYSFADLGDIFISAKAVRIDKQRHRGIFSAKMRPAKPLRIAKIGLTRCNHPAYQVPIVLSLRTRITLALARPPFAWTAPVGGVTRM